MNKMFARLHPSMLILAMAAAPAGYAATFTFTDDFEQSSLNPFWTLGLQNGSIAPSSDQAHSGTQSAKFSSTSGGDRFITLTHTFSSLMTGTASVYFYDAAPGQQTLYELLELYDSKKYPSGLGSVGTRDFDAFCYTASIDALGPNANCGDFPQQTTSNVPRTLGWHLLSLTMGPNASSVSIDGNQVYSVSGAFTFDTVTLDMQGPAGRPNTVAYFDGFSIAADPAAVPEPGTPYLVIPGLLFLVRFRSAFGLGRSTS